MTITLVMKYYNWNFLYCLQLTKNSKFLFFIMNCYVHSAVRGSCLFCESQFGKSQCIFKN